VRTASYKPLTVANIRVAKPGDILRDADIPGLHLRIFPGKAVYSVSYRSPKERKPSGKPVERRLRLGTTAISSLPEIRALARSCLAEVAKGNDPALSKRQHTAEPTIDDLFAKALDGHWGQPKYVASGWKDQVAQVYARSIKSKFGKQLARTGVTLAAVVDWHAKEAKHPRQANLALAVLSKMLNYGEQIGWRELNSNPCVRVTRHPESSRSRFATPDEVQKVGTCLQMYAESHPAAVAFLYILIFSGSRPRAIERATWDQLTELTVNGKTWGILKFQGKTGAEVVYLPPQAMAVIDRLPKTSKTITGMGLPRKLWEKIRVEAGCPDLWMRDWRRTFATVGMSGGEAMARISELLNHKSTQTTKIYAKLMDGAKIEAAGAIADRLAGMLEKAKAPSGALRPDIETAGGVERPAGVRVLTHQSESRRRGG